MLCRGCEYSLEALPAGRCPECGRPFHPADLRTVLPPRLDQRAFLYRAALGLLLMVGPVAESFVGPLRRLLRILRPQNPADGFDLQLSDAEHVYDLYADEVIIVVAAAGVAMLIWAIVTALRGGGSVRSRLGLVLLIPAALLCLACIGYVLFWASIGKL
jgi:hypothetical protein